MAYSAQGSVRVTRQRNGKDGVSAFKSTVFRRLNSLTPSTPTGGSYASPVPTSSPVWTDGIPDGVMTLWASTRIFTSDGSSPQQDAWTEPKMMTSTAKLQIKYSSVATAPGTPDSASANWSDTSSSATVWMAARTYTNGTWGDWQVSLIKGEKGDAGKDGTNGTNGSDGKDGTNGTDGKDGTNGTDGKGIVSIVGYYMTSKLKSGMTYNSAWQTSLQTPTAESPYLWRCTITTYTDGTTSQSVCELIAIYQPGSNINLLEDTAFANSDAMGAWPAIAQNILNGSFMSNCFHEITAGTQWHNAFHITNSDPLAAVSYIDILNQPITVKIEASTWYVFSFYAKGSVTGDFKSYVYPSCIDTAQYAYIDGMEAAPNSDGGKSWTLNSAWTRHTYAFKTKAGIPSVSQYVLFRLTPSSGSSSDSVYICMPKLEVGIIATTYTNNPMALVGASPRATEWGTGKHYCQGKIGETFRDIVLYDGLYYECVQTHDSTTGNTPTAGSSNSFWKIANNFNFIATKLFLAQAATINNLIADYIRTAVTGPRLYAHGNDFHLYGNGNYPALKMAVGTDGKALLQFCEESTGHVLYDLGPNGILKKKVDNVAFPASATVSNRYLVKDTLQMIVSLPSNWDNTITNVLKIYLPNDYEYIGARIIIVLSAAYYDDGSVKSAPDIEIRTGRTFCKHSYLNSSYELPDDNLPTDSIQTTIPIQGSGSMMDSVSWFVAPTVTFSGASYAPNIIKLKANYIELLGVPSLISLPVVPYKMEIDGNGAHTLSGGDYVITTDADGIYSMDVDGDNIRQTSQKSYAVNGQTYTIDSGIRKAKMCQWAVVGGGDNADFSRANEY